MFLPQPIKSINSFHKRAVWFSYIDLAKFSYQSQEDFEKDFSKALDLIEKYKNNTVIVQVRAFSDALYESSLFPISKIITQKTSLSFDPLSSMTKLVHERGLAIEAWINPYRISLDENTYQQFIKYSNKKDWIKNKDYVIEYGKYKYMFNPANQKVRDYIEDGIKEIVKNYEIDGICFDDYFYVEGTETFASENQRFDNVNMLIHDVYYSIKQINKDVTFGISPQGNYENCMMQGADIDLWLKEEGYIDYLMPQIYWSDLYGKDGKTKMFSNRAKQFASLPRHKSVSLYAGLALYKAGQEFDLDQGWENDTNNILKQVEILLDNHYQGYGIFSYSSLSMEAGKKEMQTLMKKSNHLKN